MYSLIFTKINKSNLNVLTFLIKTYGIGYKTAFDMCSSMGVHPNISCRLLDSSQATQLIELAKLRNLKLSKDLSIFEKENIKKKVNLNMYVGFRHKLGLPVRGQRTHSNAKSQRSLYRSRLSPF